MYRRASGPIPAPFGFFGAFAALRDRALAAAGPVSTGDPATRPLGTLSCPAPGRACWETGPPPVARPCTPHRATRGRRPSAYGFERPAVAAQLPGTAPAEPPAASGGPARRKTPKHHAPPVETGPAAQNDGQPPRNRQLCSVR